MDVTKETLQYAIDLSAPEIVEVDGHSYTDRELHQIKMPMPPRMVVHTLTAIADYVNSAPDIAQIDDDMLIHIVSEGEVVLYAPLSDDMNRAQLILAKLNDFSPKFDSFYNMESFNIVLQSRFVQNDALDVLKQLSGTVTDEMLKTFADDGVTQQVSAKDGIKGLDKVTVPNPVSLMPYRTFTEVAQPESQFVFRLRKDPQGIAAALFESDGGAWKNEAIRNIKEFFETNIKNVDRITILA